MDCGSATRLDTHVYEEIIKESLFRDFNVVAMPYNNKYDLIAFFPQTGGPKMKRFGLISLSVSTLMGLSLLSHNALGQQRSLKDQLVGTWTLASVADVYPDGRKEDSWGPAVKGAVNFDGDGHVMLMIIGADLPAPSTNPQDSKRAVVAYFGTYSVDEAAKTVTYTAERATAPSFDGLARKASVTLNGDELVQVSAPVTGPKGTFNPNIVWKRAK